MNIPFALHAGVCASVSVSQSVSEPVNQAIE